MQQDLDNSHSDSDQTPPAPLQAITETITKERRLGFFAIPNALLHLFSPAERLALYTLAALLAISTLLLLIGVNRVFSIIEPAQGGSLSEGEVGPVRFINPVLALSQPDQDLTELVYSGLMRAMPDGTYAPDLAQSYTISPDGTTYTFTIRADATFQDGTPVTAADVLYTVQQVQDQTLQSPLLADWEGVAVSSPDSHTVVFTLPHAYAPFIADTTLGILPKHLWENVSDEEFPFSPLNTKPVGSGPYEVSGSATDSTGSATRYDLVPFAHFTLGAPHLAHITFLFYGNDQMLEQAFDNGQIDAIAGISPSDLPSITRTDAAIASPALPRVFGVFFNQSHNPVLADLSVRQALDAALDKNAIVQSVLNGFGSPLSGPIPPGVLDDASPATPIAFSKVASSSAATTTESSFIENAQSILEAGGWSFSSTTSTWTKSKQTLSFTLSTADEPELVATANDVAAAWRAVGVQVSVQIYPLSELNENVIRPRNYDAVLFGEVVGRDLDLYAFWHSSQRNDPGLNLAMYANSQADSLLTQARATSDDKTRAGLYTQFATILGKSQPAVFLYAPDFIYLVPKDLEGVQLGALTTPAERFLNVYQWYMETQRVWSVFADHS